MRLVFFECEDWMQAYIHDQLPEHTIRFEKKPLNLDNAAQFPDAEVISVFVFSKITPEVLSALPQLKFIAARSTGFDHIDVKAATVKNVPVANVPSYGSITVAEHTWALILALSRTIYKSYERTEQANFSLEGLRGFDLNGRTLGLLGLGEIGKKVAQMSQGFNLKLRVFTRTKDWEFAHQFDNFVFVDKVEDVLTHSDIISFHVPLTTETCHLLNSENYRQLKPGCIIINTARGGLIQTQALIQALQENIVRGAGLDTLESEKTIKDESCFDAKHIPNESELEETYLNHVLIDMDNVLITPHNAFNSDESIRRLVDSNLATIKSFIAGDLPVLNAIAQ